MLATRSREAAAAAAVDEERTEKRKQSLVVLILHHLRACGYVDSAARLQTESNVSLSRFTAADNMDLLTILQEFEVYYGIKYGKPPKLSRKLGPEEKANNQSGRAMKPVRPPEDLPAYSTGERVLSSTATASRRPPKLKTSVGPGSAPQLLPAISGATSPPPLASLDAQHENQLGIVGKKTAGITAAGPKPEAAAAAAEPAEGLYDNRLLKPLPVFESLEQRELAAIITRDIFVQNPNVRWDSIVGLGTPKHLLREAVVYPLRYPE
ncbi:Katanin p60 ATPase-containing subunit A-like 2 [Cladochytrium tenue]|nr:Katanin p60 ATPase-containing subunit A-like 2 [Cladochytrium tenue]